MEQEYFFSGYCRTIDQSRIVTVVKENTCLTEIDCCYESCIHAPNCAIAAEIRKLEEQE